MNDAKFKLKALVFLTIAFMANAIVSSLQFSRGNYGSSLFGFHMSLYILTSMLINLGKRD
jgi:hypothetical protein